MPMPLGRGVSTAAVLYAGLHSFTADTVVFRRLWCFAQLTWGHDHKGKIVSHADKPQQELTACFSDLTLTEAS